MRDLDALNAAAQSTKSLFAFTLIVPFVMGWGAWSLAAGAAPSVPLRQNYLAVFALGMMAYAVISLPVPYLLKWNWETKYFGAGVFSLASASIIGVYPALCIAQYSSAPLSARILFAGIEGAAIIWWCSRFVRIYQIIYRNSSLLNYIYREESNAVYYLQRADKKIIDELLKFKQLPDMKYCLLFMLIAFGLIPFSSSVSLFFKIPFIHIFLAIGATPLSLMFLGLSTKIWLVCYLYPSKIKKRVNKRVYFDMSTNPGKYADS